MSSFSESPITRKKVLVTGAAGFIGFHLSKKLLELNFTVVGIDNVNDYYNNQLKFDRLNELGICQSDAERFLTKCSSEIYHDRFTFLRMNLEDTNALPKLFVEEQFDVVCNLAAQAGVRYSLENPGAYVQSNINGFLNVLECCRHHNVSKLVYASSSSVYGDSNNVPFSEDHRVDNPISLYAATKKTNELIAYTYSHLYGIQTIGLRLFTVYGPWGRPDMAIFLFANAIMNDKPIEVFNHGNLSRDFTYVDDIVDGIVATIVSENTKNYALYNIGNSKPVKLLSFIKQIELSTGKKAIMKMLPMQDGDVNQTYADVSKLSIDYDYVPSTSIEEGVGHFIDWYKRYYSIN